MNPLIKRELKRKKEQRRQILSKKKKDRGNDLKDVQNRINQLNRWQEELDEKEKQKNKQKITNNHKKKEDPIQSAKKGNEVMKRSWERITDQIQEENENPDVIFSKLTDYELEFMEAMTKRRNNLVTIVT